MSLVQIVTVLGCALLCFALVLAAAAISQVNANRRARREERERGAGHRRAMEASAPYLLQHPDHVAKRVEEIRIHDSHRSVIARRRMR